MPRVLLRLFQSNSCSHYLTICLHRDLTNVLRDICESNWPASVFISFSSSPQSRSSSPVMIRYLNNIVELIHGCSEKHYPYEHPYRVRYSYPEPGLSPLVHKWTLVHEWTYQRVLEVAYSVWFGWSASRLCQLCVGKLGKVVLKLTDKTKYKRGEWTWNAPYVVFTVVSPPDRCLWLNAPVAIS